MTGRCWCGCLEPLQSIHSLQISREVWLYDSSGFRFRILLRLILVTCDLRMPWMLLVNWPCINVLISIELEKSLVGSGSCAHLEPYFSQFVGELGWNSLLPYLCPVFLLMDARSDVWCNDCVAEWFEWDGGGDWYQFCENWHLPTAWQWIELGVFFNSNWCLGSWGLPVIMKSSLFRNVLCFL